MKSDEYSCHSGLLALLEETMDGQKLASNPGPNRHRIYDRWEEGLGKTSILFGEIRASASIFCVLEKVSPLGHQALGRATLGRS